MAESIHKKIERVRKPRVHITYDVETNGEITKRELPFVMGVMGDYSGDNTEKKEPLSGRRFLQIDRDNYNDIMANIAPKVSMKVTNTLENNGTDMSVSLDFKQLEDFEPHKIVEKVEPLKKLMDTRNKLRDLLTKADRSEALESLLEEILSNTNAMSSLSNELGIGKDEAKDKGGK
jgi:type VI secretion system protein ImpB